MAKKRYVYKLTFPDGMVYFGSTADVEKRWAGDGKKYNGFRVGEWIKKFGWENVKKEVVLFLEDAPCVILDVEKKMIRDNSNVALNETSNSNYAKFRQETSRDGSNCVAYIWTINGVAKPAIQWCREYKISYGPAISRVNKYGMSPLEAILAPIVPKQYTCKAEEWYRIVGYKYGIDKTSYVTPHSEWPEQFKERLIF